MKKEYSQKNLDEHLAGEHYQSPFATYLKEIVYGGNDGIITTFAVVAGFTGANLADPELIGFVTVLLFGLANLFADATSMGLGNFLSIRSDQGVYDKQYRKELAQIKNEPEYEKKQTIFILKKKGFSESDAKSLAEIYSGNEEYWVNFMMNHELEMANPGGESALWNGIATFLSFLFFGFIPLFPYLIFSEVQQSFIFSCIATFLALVMLGLIRWYVTREKLFRAVSEVVLLGGVSAIVAFVVGLFFRG